MLSNVGPPESPKHVPPVAVLFDSTMYVSAGWPLRLLSFGWDCCACRRRTPSCPGCAPCRSRPSRTGARSADRAISVEVVAAGDPAVRGGADGRGEPKDSGVVDEERDVVIQGVRRRGRAMPVRVAVQRVLPRLIALRVLVPRERRARRQDREVRDFGEVDPDVVAADTALGRRRIGAAVRRRGAVLADAERAVPGGHHDGRLEQGARAGEPAALVVEPRILGVRHVEQQLPDIAVLVGVRCAVS